MTSVGMIVAAIIGKITALAGAESGTPVLLGIALIWLIVWALLGGVASARAARAYVGLHSPN
ncbi:hypothetical protein [Mycetocola saprophilus]|uniref:hypothetical protein n=1 Tax=Mycetocola saprophilus TaxID=76636 RepID=UPI003BF3452B